MTSRGPDRPLRVAYVTWSSARDRHINALVDHRDAGAVEYTVIALSGDPGDPLQGDLTARLVPVTSLGLSEVNLRTLPAAARKLRAEFVRSQPDLVHSVLFYPALATEVARATMRAPAPSLLGRHHERRHHLAGKGFHVRLDRWMARRADRVVAASAAVRDVLIQEEGVPPGHVQVIHLGFDWENDVGANDGAIAAWRERFAGRRLLLAAGRFDPAKDYPTLIRAFADVAGADPDAHLAIAGIGPLRSEIEHHVRSAGLTQRITFLGWVPQVYPLMKAADVFVQSSTDEALPQTIIEAAGLAVPIVTTCVGGIPEIVDDSVPLIQAGDHRGFAEAVRNVLADPAGYQERAAQHAAVVRGRFDAARMAREYGGAYSRTVRAAAGAEEEPRGQRT